MGALSSLASIGLNLALAQQAAQRQSQNINAERNRQIQAIRQQDLQQQQQQQQEALRSRLATQRARAGAAGVSGGGSASAVLRGLTQEAAATEQARAAQSNARIAEIQRAASNSRSRNLLDLVGGAGGSSLSLLGQSTGRSLLDL
jgi:4-diphosphocytidyl-2C-methyl-D-erythritol kinase